MLLCTSYGHMQASQMSWVGHLFKVLPAGGRDRGADAELKGIRLGWDLHDGQSGPLHCVTCNAYTHQPDQLPEITGNTWEGLSRMLMDVGSMLRVLL